MKRSVIIGGIFPAILFSSIVDVQNHFNQKAYAQAIQEAKKSTSEYGDAKLHFLWGKSAEALGNYEEAIGAYERVLMISPDHQKARIKLAKLYANSNRMLLTKQLSEDTEDYQLTAEERNTITAFIVDDNKLINFSANIGIGYDSNINVSPGDLDISTDTQEISSKFVRFQAALSHTHQFESIQNLYLRSSAALSYQSNEESYYNLFRGLATIGLGYEGKGYDLFVPLSYARMHYLESDLLESIAVKPNMNFMLSSSLVGNLNVRVEERSYLQEIDKKRDDSVLGVGMGLYWLFDTNVAYVKANYNDYNAKYKDPLPFVGKSAMKLSTGITYDIDDKLTVSGNYSYRYTLFDDAIAQNEDERSDDYYKLDLKLSRNIFENMLGSLGYSYTSNSSNYSASEYRKHIIMCNLNYKY